MVTLEQAKIISSAFSIASTASWVVSLLPQQIDNYRYQSVDGLSLEFLLLWLTGDLLNVIGCVMTKQLPFQTYLSCYFVLNDVILDLQYYWYHDSISKSEKRSPKTSMLRTVHSPYGSNLDLSSLSPKVVAATIITAVLSNSDNAYAMPIGQETKSKIPEMGYLVAWMCTLVYTSSRVPQLYKNYCRKSVDGISPLLFTFALLGNLTYSLSILTSTRMLLAKDKWAFLMDELPYILGSAGTIFFDLFYFGQRWYYGVEPRGYISVDDVTEIESL